MHIRKSVERAQAREADFMQTRCVPSARLGGAMVFTCKMGVDRKYLLCLLRAEELSEAAEAPDAMQFAIEHGQRASYYATLLAGKAPRAMAALPPARVEEPDDGGVMLAIEDDEAIPADGTVLQAIQDGEGSDSGVVLCGVCSDAGGIKHNSGILLFGLRIYLETCRECHAGVRRRALW